jgi:hypothetical protein
MRTKSNKKVSPHLHDHSKLTAHSATFGYSVAELRTAAFHHGIAKFLSDYAFTLED